MNPSILAPVLSMALVLSGCDLLKTVRYSPSEKINVAFPFPEPIAKDLAALSASAPVEKKMAIEGEIRDALDKRATKCAGGFSPSWYESVDTVREKLQATNCLAEYDKQFARWVGFRRVGEILDLPALNLSTPSVAEITTENGIVDVSFAEHSHTALVATQQSSQVFDFTKLRTMFSEARSNSASLGKISPNGRLFAKSSTDGLKIRSTEAGETLLVLPAGDSFEFHWLDNQAAIFVEDGEVKVFDFVSNTEIPIKDIPAALRAFKVGGTPNQYLIFSSTTVAKIEIRRKPKLEVLIMSNTPAEGDGWSVPSVSGVTPDGKRLFHAFDDLILLTPDTLVTETVTFAPIRLTAATATNDPDKIYVSGYVPIDSRDPAHLRYYLFSIGSQTLSSVDIQQFQPGQGELRVIYSPKSKKNLVFRMRGRSMAVVSSLPSNDPVPLDEVRNNQQQLVNMARIAAAERDQIAAAERERVAADRARIKREDEAMHRRAPELPVRLGKSIDQYNREIEQYNRDIGQYNRELEQRKTQKERRVPNMR
jgi:hypothetical protein